MTEQLTFLSSTISAPPTYLVPTASRTLNKLSKDGLSAGTTDTSEGRDDVVDRDVAHQCHVSAHLSPSSPVTCESLGPVVSHHIDARTLASSLSVSVCVCHLHLFGTEKRHLSCALHLAKTTANLANSFSSNLYHRLKWNLLTWNPVNRRCTDLFMKLKNMSLASIMSFFFQKLWTI